MKMIFRPLVTAYASLSILLPAAGLPWPVLLPACLLALLAIGELWVFALAGRPAEAGIPAVRAGLAVLTGLLTLPAVALLLHPLRAPVSPVPLIAGAALLATVLGVAGLLRLYYSRRWDDEDDEVGVPVQRVAGEAGDRPGARIPGTLRTAAAIVLPIALSLLVGGVAIRAVERGSHPALPGYLTVALGGWAAGLTHPVAVPARGLAVPVRITSSGLPTSTAWLRLRVGAAVVATRQVTVGSGKVYALSVRVPALPPDGCLRPVGISVGGTGTVFYARSATTVPARRRTAC
ncbi:hypothetical protein ACWT_6775 [Actinoplanes sp. SE50]|uniref:hypothetical protein n=1 Tax=unclassified Actinoplanes TaxID=2626549 RepID=UPI00023ECF6C|nr:MULTISPECIES: hypothetical protein [unclassified Actinoplanes]AEV87788.1 hypothetical protein ACPL_6906 [Actinoplanes sp. SE50/110]ATO86190.1 hypothetical protein ACWT_6775 [Actinoplanes sp. SE50]SLM03604.1 hypothetical protein ACSP50_6897 [Actinoplanes sp. SE50/110]